MVAQYNTDIFEYIQTQLHVVLSFIIIMNFVIIFLMKFSIGVNKKKQSFYENLKEILIIIAHPDDEIMFLSPTIRNLISDKKKINILCLSNGGFEKIGKIREEEFARVCKELRIEDFVILNDAKLVDGKNEKWEKEYIKQKIVEYMKRDDNLEKIGAIISFDENGVTDHPNHNACNDGLM